MDIARTSYFSRKFMGEGKPHPCPSRLTQLENDAGEQITFDLSMQLKMQPVEGDQTLEGKEEDLKFYTDNVYIDQMRGGVNTGGRMTRSAPCTISGRSPASASPSGGRGSLTSSSSCTFPGPAG